MSRELGPTVCRRRLAAELRRLREAALLSGVQVAHDLNWSTSKISRLENGQILPKEKDVRILLAHYDAEPATAEFLLMLAGRVDAKEWWDAYADSIAETYFTYVGLEQSTAELLAWQLEAIPGLMQTADYARALNGVQVFESALSPGLVERRTQIRLRRQDLFDDPHWHMRAVLDESVLLRCYGGPEVMHAQLIHLLGLVERPNVSLRVLPLATARTIYTDTFVLLSFPEISGFGHIYGDIAYMENAKGGVFEEREAMTYRHRVLFDLLSDASLDEARSRSRIARLAAS